MECVPGAKVPPIEDHTSEAQSTLYCVNSLGHETGIENAPRTLIGGFVENKRHISNSFFAEMSLLTLCYLSKNRLIIVHTKDFFL